MKAIALFTVLVTAATPGPSPVPTTHPVPAAEATPVSPSALWSRRALRRARLLIQMRMLQFREERLDCVRAALLRQLPPALRPQEPTTWSTVERKSSACLR